MATNLVNNNADFRNFIVVDAMRQHEGTMVLNAFNFVLISNLLLFYQWKALLHCDKLRADPNVELPDTFLVI